jgi:hypothetical protein
MGRSFRLSLIFPIQQISRLRCVCERFVDYALCVWSCLIARLPTGYFFDSILSPTIGSTVDFVLGSNSPPLSEFVSPTSYLPTIYMPIFLPLALVTSGFPNCFIAYTFPRIWNQCTILRFSPRVSLIRSGEGIICCRAAGDDKNPQGHAERGSIVI